MRSCFYARRATGGHFLSGIKVSVKVLPLPPMMLPYVFRVQPTVFTNVCRLCLNDLKYTTFVKIELVCGYKSLNKLE